MTDILQGDAFKIYVVCLTILTANCFVLGMITAVRRGKYKNPATPEDSRDGTFPDKLAPEVDRARRVHNNAAENVPALLVTGLTYTLSGASAAWVGACMGLATVARLLHAVFYLKAVQPWRSIAFVASNVAMFTMLGHMLKRAFAS